jgi:hypothetical protein
MLGDLLTFIKTAVAADPMRKSGLVAIGTGNQSRESDILSSPASSLAHGTVTFFG